MSELSGGLPLEDKTMGGDKDKKRDKDKKKDKEAKRRDSSDGGSPERGGRGAETEEERRRRRAEKKARKAEREAEKARQFMGYTNDANPWNDARLTEKFTWGKREQKLATNPPPPLKPGEAAGGALDRGLSDKERRAALQAELARVKAAREAREAERDEWEREKERIEREREQFACAPRRAARRRAPSP